MVFTGARMPETERDAVRDIATREGVSWSVAARLLLAYAVPRMPKDWRPAQRARRAVRDHRAM